MATSETFDLGAYMSNSIRNIMAKAYKSVLSNPRGAMVVPTSTPRSVVTLPTSRICSSLISAVWMQWPVP